MAFTIDPIGLAMFLHEAAKAIHELAESYVGSSRELTLIEVQIGMFQTHVELISEWLEASPGTSRPAPIKENIQKALSLLHDAIFQLNFDLQKVYANPTSRVGNLVTTAVGFGRAVKAKYALNERMLQKHLTHLRECGVILGMALQATQLHSQDETNQRLRDVGASVNLVRRGTKKVERQQLRENQESTETFKGFLDFLDANESETPFTNDDSASRRMPEINQSATDTGPVHGQRILSFPMPSDSPPPYEDVSTISSLSTVHTSRSNTTVTDDTFCSITSRSSTTSSADGVKRPSDSLISPVLRSQRSMPLRRKPVGSRQGLESSTSINATISNVADPSSVHRFPSSDNLSRMAPKEKYCTDYSPNSPSDCQVSNGNHAVSSTAQANKDSRIFPANRQPGQDSGLNLQGGAPPKPPLPALSSRLSGPDSGTPHSGTGHDRFGPRKGFTALHQAVRELNAAVVVRLVEQGASIHARDSKERTPLHYAASISAPISRYLVEHGAQIDSRDEDSRTPLFVAAESGQSEVVGLMLGKKIGKRSEHEAVSLSIFVAIENGHIDVVQKFIHAGFSFKKLKRDSHQPAHLAAKSGNLQMLNLLIENKTSLNEKDEKGLTSLHVAALYGRSMLISRLLEKGGSIKSTNSDNETPLHLAAKSGDFATVEALLKTKNVPINEKDKRDQEAIHHVVRLGHVAMFNNLIASGARVTTENSFGWQPIHIASAYGHTTIAQQLVADKNVPIDEKLGTSSVKQAETSKIVEQGLYAEAHWPYPASRPLHLAAEFGRADVANLLIERGAKIDATCSAGWRPLHLAAFNGNTEIVERLLAAGASPMSRTNQNKTALDLGFRTNGDAIPDHDKEAIQVALQAAMPAKNGSRSLSEYRNALRIKPSTVQDKEKAILAVAQAKRVLSLREKQAITTVEPLPVDLDAG